MENHKTESKAVKFLLIGISVVPICRTFLGN